MDGAVSIYFEAVAVTAVLVLLGQALELRAREKTSGAIRALLGSGAQDRHGHESDGRVEPVALDNVRVVDLVCVRPGRNSACGRRGRGGQGRDGGINDQQRADPIGKATAPRSWLER